MREQQIQRAHHVVHLREDRVLAVDHRIRRGALLGEMHHRIGRESLHHLSEKIVVRDVAREEFDLFAGDLFHVRSRSGRVRIGVSVCTPSS